MTSIICECSPKCFICIQFDCDDTNDAHAQDGTHINTQIAKKKEEKVHQVHNELIKEKKSSELQASDGPDGPTGQHCAF